MNKVFMFDELTISIDMGQSLSTATGIKVLYKKPDSTTGVWNATAVGNSVTYNLAMGQLDQPGLWQFEARVNLNGRSTGQISTQYVEKPLDA